MLQLFYIDHSGIINIETHPNIFLASNCTESADREGEREREREIQSFEEKTQGNQPLADALF